ncbi:RNA polymerase I associated factor, A49-like protein [Tirmania nivea]|nr:RNA polymerase I associated factor, A49-like protein [Tirmania nivea]
MPSSPERKRKRDSHAPVNGLAEVTVKIVENTDFIPIVATTPGVQIPANTQLTAYSRPRAAKKNKTSSTVEYIVHGSTERIDYEGREVEEDVEEKYYIGIYDPKTGEMQMHPAPRVHIRREIKSLREKDAELAKRNTLGDGYSSARALLGAEFGTKKSRKAIERRKINQVNVNDMDAMVTTSIVSQIGENTESMPTKEDLVKAAEERRLLPPHKIEGITSPSEVYNLDDVVSKEELDYVWVQDWYKEAKAGKAIYVPNNSHVTQRINKLGLAKTPNATNTKKLKLLKYISILRNLYMFFTSRDSRNLLLFGKEIEMRHKLNISGDLLTILLKRYTETVGGPSAPGVSEDKGDLRPRRRASPVQLAKLLNYMAILCLFVEENWQVDVFYLKDDLGLQTRAVLQIFQNVGCKKREVSPIQAEALGIPKSEIKMHKIATLTAKPEFPKPRTMRRAAKN